MTQEQIIAMIVVVGLLIVIFVVSFMLNKNTPKPEGCEDLEAECETCSNTACLKNNSQKEEK